VDPQYGSLADMDRLIAEGKRRNIRVVLDMVMNHTSDKHKWFQESKSSRTNPKADWYVWNNGKPVTDPSVTAYEKKFEHEGRVPPNNWVSLFGGSAWEWVPERKQFYYHKFYKQQPDLNWRNPAVEQAMFGAMRFWLDRGVAGFRLDAIPTLFEDAQLRDEPEKSGLNAQGDPNLNTIYTNNLPEVHDVIRRMRAMVDKYPGQRVLIGETYLPNTAELDRWYGGAAQNELQLPMDLLVGFGTQTLNAAYFRRYISEVETQVHGSQPLLVFDNHDRPRSWDRFGDKVHNTEIAKLLATVLLTTRATALMYYGEEIGMATTVPTRVEDVKDPIGITGWPKEKGRDGERTPMQWDASNAQAGFSPNPKTWLPVPSSYKTTNVETELARPDSLLNFYKRLIALRRTNPALHNGGMVMLNKDNADVLSYVRTAPKGSSPVVVAINMSAAEQVVTLDLSQTGVQGRAVRTLLASDASLESASSLQNVKLPPYSAWVGAVQ
jgi:alpha-glucosidase